MNTNSYREIGGYFELELENRFNNIQGNVIALNTARNALRYIIQTYKIKEIYAPYYTCPVVWQVIEKEDCKIKYYHIDNSFMPTEDFPQEAFVLYTNYFGICAKNVKVLAKKYKNLIVDNAQAFYMPKYGIASFNSIRKFFGIPDGALLYTDKKSDENFEQDTSYQRCSHLLKRLDINAKFGYQDFQNNENSLINEPIKYVSNLSKTIFNSIDTDKVKHIRLNNFRFLHSKLKQFNEFNIKLDCDDVPLVYPYLVKNLSFRQKLIQNNIYVAQYWNPLPEEYQENIFQKYILPLPIDQRYNIEDIKRVLGVINDKN